LNEAAVYAEKAFVILTEHGAYLPNYSELLSIVFQSLGLVYGELALEVVDSQERQTYRNQAVVMLSKAVDHLEDPVILYQLALALSEVGEFEGAISNLDKSIELEPHNPASYNLLALLLSSRSQYEKAAQAALVGWTTCVSYQSVSQKGHLNVNGEAHLIWENIDPGFKEELLRFACYNLVCV
jgi:tetratricopeptide (TPR) repeat protein